MTADPESLSPSAEASAVQPVTESERRAAANSRRTNLGSCQGRYSTGEFKDMKCIEYAKQTRYGVRLCTRHANVFDRWMSHGFDYAWSVTRLEWRLDLNTGESL